jgi:hypothetical protein
MVEEAARRFAKATYRYVARSIGRISASDRSSARETIHMSKAELTSSIKALYSLTGKERQRRVIDEVMTRVLEITTAYADMATSNLRKSGVATDICSRRDVAGFRARRHRCVPEEAREEARKEAAALEKAAAVRARRFSV